MTVTPSSASLRVGATAQITAEARDAAGNVLTGRPITWTSSASSVASVSSNGLITAVAPGAATITAASGGASAAVAVAVAPQLTAATLLATLATPNVDDGGVLFVVTGPAVDSIVTRPYDGTSATSGNRTKVLVFGKVTAGAIARVYIPDASRAAEYSVQLLEVASRTTFAQRPLAQYGLSLQRP